MLKFNQTLQNYIRVSVGTDTYNLTNHNKIQVTDTTEIKFPNKGSDLLQKWKIKCNNNKIDQSRITDFIRTIKTNSPTCYSGETSFPPYRNSFYAYRN